MIKNVANHYCEKCLLVTEHTYDFNEYDGSVVSKCKICGKIDTYVQTKENKCLYCNKEISKEIANKFDGFCSKECFDKAFEEDMEMTKHLWDSEDYY